MSEMEDRDLKEFLKLAQETDSFLPSEIDVLESVLQEYKEEPDSGYIILKEDIEGKIAGFIIFGKIPGTEFSWDIYWIVVAKDFQGYGIGKALLKDAEEYILNVSENAVLRVETSGKPSYSKVRNFYSRCGFTLAGRIVDFYSPGDDLIIFSKRITRPPRL